MKLPQLAGPQPALAALWRRVPRQTRITFPAALALGLGVHGFMLANKFVNHDDLSALLGTGTGYGVASGRWLLPWVLRLDGQVSAPWLLGILSLLLLAAACCLVVSLLRLRGTVSCVLSAALLVTFPTVTATLGYMFTATAYFISLLLACLSVLLTVRFRWGFAAGAVLLTLSMGIYQSYFAVAAVLMVAALLLEALDNERPLKALLLRCGLFLATLALALLLYVAMVGVTTPESGLSDYMGISSMGQLPRAELPRLVLKAYTRYSQLYKLGGDSPVSAVLPVCIGLALAAGAALAVAILLRRRLGALRLALVGVLAALLPLAGGLVYLMAPLAETHQLMLYGTCFVLLIPLMLYEYHATLAEKPCRPAAMAGWAAVIALGVVAFQYAIYANTVYTKMHLTSAQLAAYSNRLVSAIESSELYTREVEVALVYDFQEMDELMPGVDMLPEIQLIGVQSAEYLFKTWICQQFLTHYVAFPNKIYVSSSNYRARELGAQPQVADMPCYPQRGCMALVEGCLVVKLSE